MYDMDVFLCISCKSCKTSIILSMRTTWSYCKRQSKRTPRSCYRWGPLRCLHWLTRQLFISFELRWWPLFRSVFQTPQSTWKITVAYRFEPRTHFQICSEEVIHEVYNIITIMWPWPYQDIRAATQDIAQRNIPIRERWSLHMYVHQTHWRIWRHPCDAHSTSYW